MNVIIKHPMTQKIISGEVMIGNYLHFKTPHEVSKLIQVTASWFCNKTNDSDFESNTYYKPVPITEKWLYKFGFIERNSFYSIVVGKDNKARITLWFPVKDKIIMELNKNGYSFFESHDIKFVHQLQNLYFALTQTHLTATKTTRDDT